MTQKQKILWWLLGIRLTNGQLELNELSTYCRGALLVAIGTLVLITHQGSILGPIIMVVGFETYIVVGGWSHMTSLLRGN